MIRSIISSVLILSLIVSCEPALKVTTDYDKTVNFTQYKSFSMVKLESQNISISELNADRIIKAIKSELTKKGFQENDQSPDLKVFAVTVLKDKKVVTANSNYYGYGGMYRPYGWSGGTGYTTYDVHEYIDGSLIIDLVDAKTDKLVWEGIGNKEIDSPAKDAEAAINAAVAQIMASFPPGVAAPAKK